MDARMQIQVNGESREVPQGIHIDALLRSFELEPAMIVVEHNGNILRRLQYSSTQVEPGDALELVHFVGGG